VWKSHSPSRIALDAAPIRDEDLEWLVRLSLECRRHVEQQKRIGSAELRNTRSYRLGKVPVKEPAAAGCSARRGDLQLELRERPFRSFTSPSRCCVA
jgi:hypothetical protein